ncbi:hypothetical protein [Spirosoma sp. KUDC1026]|uniref:hypothetical protein n=1 Tax=Spirosoma sp. KUDC1026 TaxID=2745947 RepID=UPI00159BAD80|nr:hypothetical protein [Spirosoma sp. KUDC1026]QKZ11155.1 hypothetical protein HU175_00265 [Spirosoma sp. KUDC1026]
MQSPQPASWPARIRKGYAGLFLYVLVLTLPGCVTTRIITEPDANNPDNVPYDKRTSTAYFWGLLQPKDFEPPCDPRANHLNGVMVETTFGQYLLSAVTLGIVSKRRVQWRCMPYVPPTDSI